MNLSKDQLLERACEILNPVTGTSCTFESDSSTLAAMCDACDAVPDGNFPINGVTLTQARQLSNFVRANA